MPFNLDQQQPEHFPFLTELENRVHPLTKWCLAGMGLVGGYFWGIGQDRLPVALCIALGLVGGLLFIGILKHLTTFMLGAVIVFALAAGTFFLLQNDAAMKGNRASHSAAPAHSGRIADLVKAVQP